MLRHTTSPLSPPPRPRGRSPAGPEETQTRLLKSRGELSQTSLCFDAQLAEPWARNGPRRSGSEHIRLGLEVMQTDADDMEAVAPLVVASVDSCPVQITPVAQWNTREIRHGDRGGGECHQSFEIRPGDRILAVNGAEEDNDKMLDVLAAAASLNSPKSVAIKIERDRPDILEPSPGLQTPTSVRTPSRTPMRTPVRTPARTPASSLSPRVQNAPSCITSPQFRVQTAPTCTTSPLQRQGSAPSLLIAAQSAARWNAPGPSCRPPKPPSSQSPAWITRGRTRRSRDEQALNSTSTLRSTSCPMSTPVDPKLWSSFALDPNGSFNCLNNSSAFSNSKRSNLSRSNVSQTGLTMLTSY